VARVQLLDANRADAPSLLVAETVLPPGMWSFELLPPAGGPPLILRAHVSLSGSTEVKDGDYVTMESYPVVAPYSDETDFRLTVRRV